jgi:hypothetical protein
MFFLTSPSQDYLVPLWEHTAVASADQPIQLETRSLHTLSAITILKLSIEHQGLKTSPSGMIQTGKFNPQFAAFAFPET